MALLLFTYPSTVPFESAHPAPVDIITVLLGALVFLIAAQASARAGAFLTRPVLQFFGRISFSLYLYHALVLLTVLHLLYGRMPLAAVLGLAWVAGIAVATAAYYLIEAPAHRAGRSLSRRVRPAPRPQGPR